MISGRFPSGISGRMTTIRIMAQASRRPQIRIGSVTRADNYTKFYIMMGIAAHYHAKTATSQKYQLITGMICVWKCGIGVSA